MTDNRKPPEITSGNTTESTPGISRRRFIQAAGAAGLAAGVGPLIIGRRAQAASGQKTLKILQWSHFVPTYDTWFDDFAQQWGKENGVNVTVDHISIADLTAATASELSAGSGHDLIELGPEAAQFEPSLLDMADINQEITSEFGQPFDVSKRVSYNPVTDRWYSFCHGWTIDPGDYRKSLWEKAGMPQGPSTWEELAKVGARIRDEQGVPAGLGMSQELDSNMAARAVLWSFGGAVQDESGKVVLDQGQYFKNAVEAVKYLKHLQNTAMTPEVFAWNAASNNQALIAGRASFILNSISAYRSAQDARPDIAKDVFFSEALTGPGGEGWANVHVLYNYVMPKFASAREATAKDFIKHLVRNYDQAMYESKLYNSPSYFSTPISEGDRGYSTVSGATSLRDLHNAWFDNDPFKLEGEADGKLKPLKGAADWTTNLGHPGSTNPAVGEVFNTFILPNMVARVARGGAQPEDAVRRAAEESRRIFEKWRERGLI